MIAQLIEIPKGHKLYRIEWLAPTKFVVYFNRKKVVENKKLLKAK